MGAAAPSALGSPWPSRSDRVGARMFGLGFHPGQKGAEKPERIRQIKEKRVEAPCCFGRKRHTALCDAQRGKRARLDGLRRVDRRYRAHQASPWQTEKASQQASRLPKAYDDKKCKEALRKRSIRSRIARKGVESSEKLGRHRWVVERTLAWLSKYRRLTIRYERRDDIHEAFLHLGCSLICLNYLT
jgi:transposase